MTLNFFVTLEVYLTTLFSKIFCFSDFFSGTGQDRRDRQTNRQTDKQTDIRTDRLFSGNIILDIFRTQSIIGFSSVQNFLIEADRQGIGFDFLT